MINAPSLANCSLLDMGGAVDELVSAGITRVHVDVMDGHYVPNLCFPPSFVGDLTARHPQLEVDVHLMVEDPDRWIDVLARAGARWVSFPSDSTRFARRTIAALKAAGLRAGVGLNPSQRVDVIEPYATDLDYVVLMAVEPGFSGQPFLPSTLDRLEQLVALRDRNAASFVVEVDAGITEETGRQCLQRGAEILVTGIYVTFNQPDGIAAAVRRFARQMATVAG